MADLTAALEYYINLVDLLDAETSDPDVMQILHTRDLIERNKLALNQRQVRELFESDAWLAEKWQIVTEFVPHPAHQDRTHWWWFLHEGPQVRTQAREQVHA